MGSLVPLRFVLLLIGILAAIGFASGHLFWNKDQYACFNGKHWAGGVWYNAYSIGKLDIRFHEYGCPPSDRYDPTKFKPADGAYPIVTTPGP